MIISRLIDQTRAIPTPIVAGDALARLKAVIDAENMAENGYANRVYEHPTTKVGKSHAIIGLKLARAVLVGLIFGLPFPGTIGKSP